MNPFARAAAPLAACLLAVLPATAAAQSGITPLRVGQTVSGALVESDEPVNDRGRFHAYRFEAAQGQRLVATARSSEFDTYLVVGRQVGPVLDELKTDDDGGEDTNSRLRFTAPRAGSYLLLVQSFSEEGMGPFTLSLQEGAAPTTGGTESISFGTPVQGALADTDDEDAESGKFFDPYAFRGRAGQRVEISMESDDFDPYVALGRLDGCDWEELETDDDGGEGTNARLRHVIREDGEYVVRATSFSENTGAYTLTLRERPVPPPPVSRRITSGEPVASALDEDDAVLETDDSFYEVWTYAGRAGEEVRISMESDDFDTYLALGRMVGGEFEELATMDDGGEGTNSLLVVTLPADDEYVVRANSLNPGETGEYDLRVDSSRDP